MGILVCGSRVPHKHPRRPPFGALGWATWRTGRLTALQAPREGAFALWPVKFKGRTVHLNFKTSPAGYVKVEASYEGAQGRTFEECDRLCGDHLDRVVTWKGQSDIGHAEGSPVALRFRLRSAELYSVRFE